MSVEYYSCEWCGEAVYEEKCCNRSVGDDEIYVCDWCLEEYERKGLIIPLTDGDDNFSTYSHRAKEQIRFFGIHYQLTALGIEAEIKNIENDIQKLQNRMENLQRKASIPSATSDVSDTDQNLKGDHRKQISSTEDWFCPVCEERFCTCNEYFPFCPFCGAKLYEMK